MTDDTGAGSAVAGGDPNASSPLLDSTALAQLGYESAQLSAAAKQGSPPENGMGWVNPRAAELDYQHAQAAATAATGAGFEFTPEQIDTQLAHCKQQIDDLRTDLQQAQQAQLAVHPPAPDAASVAQAKAVQNMLAQTAAAIQADIAYLTDWQAKLTDAKTRYMTNEHLTTDQWSRLANGLQS
jgi:hypothetical protein